MLVFMVLLLIGIAALLHMQRGGDPGGHRAGMGREVFYSRTPGTRRTVAAPSAPSPLVSTRHASARLLAEVEPSPRKPSFGMSSVSAPSRLPTTDLTTLGLVPTSRPPSSASLNYLCPSLKVPEGCECTLLLPRMSTKWGQTGGCGKVRICDLSGNAVFQTAFCLPVGGVTPAPSRDAKRLVLSSATNGRVFAFCGDGPLEGDGSLISLSLHGADEPFGVLRALPRKRCDILAHSGWRARIQESAAGCGGLTVTDERGNILATTELMREDLSQRCMRISALADAGLLILAVLGADLLESAAWTEATSCRRATEPGGLRP